MKLLVQDFKTDVQLTDMSSGTVHEKVIHSECAPRGKKTRLSILEHLLKATYVESMELCLMPAATIYDMVST